MSYEGKGTEQSAVADIEAFIEEEVSKAFAMLNEGDDAMRTNLRVAYDRYVRGLQSLLSLDKSHPKVIALKQKIAKYVREAENVKEALEQCPPLVLGEAPWRRSSPPLVLAEAKCPRH